MTEAPSETANHQRLDEMWFHLTPVGGVIPYTTCIDAQQHVWVAAKGGLFKVHSETKEVLLERKNDFPKKMMPYCQVHAHEDKVIHIQSGDEGLTEFRILDLAGNVLHEQFLDGKIQSFAVSPNGDMFLTKQPQPSDSFHIFKAQIDAPLGWDEFCSAYDYCFQALCLLEDGSLVAATSTVPINLYSKQTLKIIDAGTGKIRHSFSTAGKEDGQIFFPRSIKSFNNDILVLDKTGRFQVFEKQGNFKGIAAAIDAYLGNGFVVKDDHALLACSGIVTTPSGENVCDDWLELIKLDGSKWTADPPQPPKQ